MLDIGVSFTPALGILFAIVIAVVGMPHGGLDHLFGRKLLQHRLGKSWQLMFGLLYLGTAAVVVAGWLFLPALTVIGFFLISAYHFGDADGEQGIASVLFGGAVIWIPLLTRPDEVARIMAWIVPHGDELALRHTLAEVQPLLAALTMLLLGMAVARLFRGEWQSGIRPLAFAGLFVLAPTLLSFTIYFCGWHSTRELATLARKVNPRDPLRGFRTLLWLVAPRTIAAVLIAAVAAGWFAEQRAVTSVVVQSVFIALSAVAVPHILLHAVAARMGADPFTRREGM